MLAMAGWWRAPLAILVSVVLVGMACGALAAPPQRAWSLEYSDLRHPDTAVRAPHFEMTPGPQLWGAPLVLPENRLHLESAPAAFSTHAPGVTRERSPPPH
jgi:hypothetical protein